MASGVVLLDVCFDDQAAANQFIERAAGSHPDLGLSLDPNGSPRGTHRLIGKVNQQQAVDQIVDLVRAGGVSIARLDVQRPSLEDTFMKLVGKATQEDSGS